MSAKEMVLIPHQLYLRLMAKENLFTETADLQQRIEQMQKQLDNRQLHPETNAVIYADMANNYRQQRNSFLNPVSLPANDQDASQVEANSVRTRAHSQPPPPPSPVKLARSRIQHHRSVPVVSKKVRRNLFPNLASSTSDVSPDWQKKVAILKTKRIVRKHRLYDAQKGEMVNQDQFGKGWTTYEQIKRDRINKRSRKRKRKQP